MMQALGPDDAGFLIHHEAPARGQTPQRRTESLLLATLMVARAEAAGGCAMVQMCGACDRGRQSFNRPHATLSPLSIRGLLHRWSIDLCGPFPLTRQLNSYCMVLVEGHCRWAEMVAIPGKESARIARVFLERVVGRYGCCAAGGVRWRGGVSGGI